VSYGEEDLVAPYQEEGGDIEYRESPFEMSRHDDDEE
jgi:hypothetical protein